MSSSAPFHVSASLTEQTALAAFASPTMELDELAPVTTQMALPVSLLPVLTAICQSVRLALDMLLSAEALPAAHEKMHKAGALFHQVAGALELAGMDGAAALPRLMQMLLQDTASDKLALSAEMAAALQAASHALLDYVSTCLRGQPQQPLTLFPCYRRLAALSAWDAAHPAALLSLRITSPLPSFDGELLVLPAENLRLKFEQALLVFLRSNEAAERQSAARQMAVVLATIAPLQPSDNLQAYWHVLHAFADMVATDEAANPALAKKIFAAIFGLVRHLEDQAMRHIAMPLVREALYAVATAPSITPLARQVAAVFQLDLPLAVTPDGQGSDESDETAETERFFDLLVALKARLEQLVAFEPQDLAAASVQLQALAVAARSVSLLSPFAADLHRLAGHAEKSGLVEQDAVQLAVWILVVEQGLSAPEPAANWLAREHMALLDALSAIASTDKPRLVIAPELTLARMATAMQQHTLVAALTTAIVQCLAVLESHIEDAVETASMDASLPVIDTGLAQLGAILSLINETDAGSLIQEIRAMFSQHGAARLAEVASSFALLSQHVAAIIWQPFHAEKTVPIQFAQADAERLSAPTGSEPIELTLSPEGTDSAAGKNDFNPSPALCAIYLNEAQQLIAQLSRLLQNWEEDPVAGRALEAMQAAHSLAGSSATVGAQTLQELAAPLEIVFHLVAANAALLQAADLALLREAVSLLEQMLAALLAHQVPQHQPDLINKLCVLCERLQEVYPLLDLAPDEDGDQFVQPEKNAAAWQQEEPLAPSHPAMESEAVDPELLAIFSEEAAELLPQLDQQIRIWQDRPEDKTPASVLLRLLHTLKGSARMAGEAALGQQFHEMEHTAGQLLQAASLDAKSIASLLTGLDCAMQLFSRAGQHAASSAPEKPQRQLVAPVQFRVRADLLDRVASSAAELAVGGARLDGELDLQRQAMSELSGNIGRLRNQLRELEIQAETQIASQLSPAASAEFDPLEFDRFTRLQEVTRILAESLGDVVSVQRTLAHHMDSAGMAISLQLRHARSLQADLRRVRIVPFSSVAERLHHLVRQVGRELGKQVRLEITDGSVELDRGMLEKLGAPLEHVLRNAVVHGIEIPAQRLANGKNEQGLLQISLTRQGNDVVLQIRDDGRGLDLARIHEQAIAAGLLAAGSQPTEAELAALIFQPGLSTSAEITELAGRGIGMDVVRASVIAQGGTLTVASHAGLGTCFTLSLPLTLAAAQVVLVLVGERQFAFPSAMVQQVLQLPAARMQLARQAAQVEWREAQLSLYSLRQLLGETSPPLQREQPASIVILRGIDSMVAIELDAVIGNREVVVKNSGPQLAQVPGFVGATILADGSIVLIINPLSLIQAAAPSRQAGMMQPLPQAGHAGTIPVVLVVDDSLTVRRVSQRFLERHGYAAVLARDGLDALEKLQSLQPSAILLDIEMPRMDGFDLLRNVRQDARLKEVPVVMITSRAASRHREHALQLGATDYLGKPFLEAELLELLKKLCHLPD